MTPSTALVLSGGASLGAVQVGMLQALAERGVCADMAFGASVGAINAAWVAGDPALERIDDLAALWQGVRTRAIFPIHPLTGLLGFVGRRDSLVPSDGLRRLVNRHLQFAHIEDAPIPLRIVATEVTTGTEVVLDHGDTVDAILASAAIPGVFPPVTIDGRTLIDGGVVNNTPISHAISAGATRVYVLPTGYACKLERPPGSALAMVLQAVSLLVEHRLIRDVEQLETEVDLRVIPPLCPMTVSPADFSHAGELIERSRVEAGMWLDRREHFGPGVDQSVWLRFHPHH